MKWEYKVICLATPVKMFQSEDERREKEETILNELGRAEWEAVNYDWGGSTALLKRPIAD